MPNTWVVIGSSNGSSNYGDEMMWMNLVRELRRLDPSSRIVTDAFDGWRPPFEEVAVLPFLHKELLRYRMRPSQVRVVNKVKAAFGLAINRGSAERGYRRSKEVAHGAELRGLEVLWDKELATSSGLIFSGAGGITDRFALHAIAGWGLLVALAQRRGIPVLFLGQGVGPIVDGDARTAASRMLGAADLVGVRDRYSLSEVKDLAPETGAAKHLDWAVATATPETVTTRVERWIAEQGLAGCLALSIHDWTSATEAQRDQVRIVVRRAAEFADSHDMRVLCVPNCVGTFRANDRAFMQNEIDRLPARLRGAFQQTPVEFGAYETRRALREASFLVTTRYHPLVFALSEGTPAVGLAYDDYYLQKHRGALAWYGLESWVDDVRTFDPDPAWWEHYFGLRATVDAGELRARTENLRAEPVRALAEWVARSVQEQSA